MTCARRNNPNDEFDDNLLAIREQLAKSQMQRKTVKMDLKRTYTLNNKDGISDPVLRADSPGFRITEYVKHYDFIHRPFEDKVVK